MKIILLAFALCSQGAFALPVFNQNMAAEGTLVTIWPDHKDQDHFYFAPNLMKISVNQNNQAKFNLTKYLANCNILRKCHEKALLNVFFVAGHRQEELLNAQAGILKRFPKARFSPIPFLASKVEFSKTMAPFIDQHDCAPMAGQTSDEVPCSMTLNNRGINHLLPRLNEGKVFPFKFYYKISGVLQSANGQYSDHSIDYSLVVNLGGDILINHDDLINE